MLAQRQRANNKKKTAIYAFLMSCREPRNMFATHETTYSVWFAADCVVTRRRHEEGPNKITEHPRAQTQIALRAMVVVFVDVVLWRSSRRHDEPYRIYARTSYVCILFEWRWIYSPWVDQMAGGTTSGLHTQAHTHTSTRKEHASHRPKWLLFI